MQVSRYCFKNNNNRIPITSRSSLSHFNRPTTNFSKSNFSVIQNDAQLGNYFKCNQDMMEQQRHFRYHRTFKKKIKRKVAAKSSKLNHYRSLLAASPPEAFKRIAAAITKPPSPPFLGRFHKPWYSLPRLRLWFRIYTPIRNFIMRRFFHPTRPRNSRWPNRYTVGFRGYDELETPGSVYSPYLSTWIAREKFAKTSSVLIPTEEVRHDYAVYTFMPRLKHKLINTAFNLMKSENRNFNMRDWNSSMNLQFVPMLLYGIWNQDYELLRQFMVHDYNIHYTHLRQDRDGKELGLKGTLEDPDVESIKKEWDKWKTELIPKLNNELKAVEEQIEKEKKEGIFKKGEFNLDYTAAEEDLYRKGWTQAFQDVIDRHLEPNHPLRQSSLSEEKKVKYDKLLLEEVLDRCNLSKQMYKVVKKEHYRIMRRIRTHLAYEVEPEHFDPSDDLELDNYYTSNMTKAVGELGSAYLDELYQPQDYYTLKHGVRDEGMRDIQNLIEKENEEKDRQYEIDEEEKESVPSVVLFSDLERYKGEMDALQDAFISGVETPRRRLYAYEMKKLAHLIFPMFRAHLGDGLPNMQMKVYRVRPVKVKKIDIYTHADTSYEEKWQNDQIKPYIDSMQKLYLKQLKGEQLSLSNEEMQNLINAAEENEYDWESIPYEESNELKKLPHEYDFQDELMYFHKKWDERYKKQIEKENKIFELEKRPFRWLRSAPPLDAEERFHAWRMKRARSSFGDTDLYSHLRHPSNILPEDKMDLEEIEKFKERLGKRIEVKFSFHFGITGVFGNIVTSEMRFYNRLRVQLATDPTLRTKDWQIVGLRFDKPRRKM